MSSQAAARKPDHPYVERRPGVQGGRAVLRGTRFPVSSIVQCYRSGLTVEEIVHEFPQLSPAEVHDSLSYYYDHREEIDREIEESEDIAGTLNRYPPTLVP